MKKTVIILLIMIFAFLIFGNGIGKWPFKDLTRNEIVDVSLFVDPPRKTAEIEDEFQIQVLVGYLKFCCYF